MSCSYIYFSHRLLNHNKNRFIISYRFFVSCLLIGWAY